MTISQWRQMAIAKLDPEVIRVILQLQREYVELFHSWPSVDQILARLSSTPEREP